MGYGVTKEDIEKLLGVGSTLLKLKYNKLEDAVEGCEGVKVRKSYNEYRKLEKTLKKVYNEYKDALKGLGNFATDSVEISKKVNRLLKKYDGTKFYFEIINGDLSEEE